MPNRERPNYARALASYPRDADDARSIWTA
jgi:hypothetical protein